ncbi:YaiO family outer membrane beta-barrel protein [Maribacter algicola]|uniref:YaiO family outer membrane beta-barrel protein n=1 Tax=Meishania litoralis TaxID=3434685 RepID=A0ACC7LKN4_9FLAO
MKFKKNIFVIVVGLLFYLGNAQDVAYNDAVESSYSRAFDLAYEGDSKSAQEVLYKMLDNDSNDLEVRSLLASTLSWNGKYDEARLQFNRITSKDRSNREVWISAIKNELYAKNYATALGLSNKALHHLKNDSEVERLKQLALNFIADQEYSDLAWFNQKSSLKTAFTSEKKSKKTKRPKKIDNEKGKSRSGQKEKPEASSEKPTPKNRFSVGNSFTVFDQRYDPAINSSISLKHQTKYGSIIPSINYSNRVGKQGLQYDLSLYPKIAKRMYAYVNYGYSSAIIYPKHRFAGDVYLGLPGAIEFSAGGRYIMTRTQNVTAITNSLGHYRGNYYFSLRSYITPRPDRLTRFSGNLLIRKYLRDGENYFGFTFGMGFSPELRQLFADDELLAETLLYVESQRLGLAYQFTPRKTPNIYRTNISVRRQEFAFDSGNFFWAISAGLTYNVKF